MTQEEMEALIVNRPVQPQPTASRRSQLKTIPQGAATSVWAGVVAPAEEVGGRYCEDCHVAAIDDVSARGGVRSYALDPEQRQGAVGKERRDGRRAVLTVPTLIHTERFHEDHWICRDRRKPPARAL